MANSPHRIRRQRWTLQAGSTAAAFVLRQHLRQDWQEALLPAFEKVFDQEAPGEKVLRIPRIELTLRVGSDEKAGPSWSAVIHEQLVRQLREVLRTRHGVEEEPAEWKQSTAQQDRFQNLLHYLSSGSLPWEAATISAVELAVDLEEICRERRSELVALLRAGPAPSLAFCFRLLQLLPADEAIAVVRAILGEPSFPWLALLLEMLGGLLAPEQKHFGRHSQLLLAALFVSEALAALRTTQVPDLVRSARRALPFESGALDDFLASLPALARPYATAQSTPKPETAATKRVGVHADNSSPALVPKIPGGFRKSEPPARRRQPTIPDSPGDARRAPPLGSEPDDLMTSLPASVSAHALADSISKAGIAPGKKPGLSTESASPADLAETPGGVQKKDSPSRSDAMVPDSVHPALSESKALTDLIGSLPTPAGTRAADKAMSDTEPAAPGETGLRKRDSNFASKPKISRIAQEEDLPSAPDATLRDSVRLAAFESKALSDLSGSLPIPANTAADDTISRVEAAALGETGLGRRAASNPTSAPQVPGAFQKEELLARVSPWTQSSLSKSTSEAAFPLLAAHAGLILLHPFLPRFFESTGIKEPASVDLSPFALPRAAALLHYLATGRDAVYEYDLVFIKVLLGLNAETPLCVSEGLLAGADREETEALLESAITHWTALKNTSSAGFRSSFLDRRALLREEDNGWKLQVERQPFDVLLDHLPWSISVVKLPWMKRLIHTEW
jgi:hypothetical protein